ncbi:PXPV repeat protein [Pseudoduganella sp. UC29_106]|uniref:PXPV repeat protein n=1 Tax=Pseudoduganella sp. UC29_106 TaxID=3374553 RepID=UPI0037568BB0
MFDKRIAGLVLMGAALTASSAAFAAGDRDFNTAAGAVLGAAIGSQNGPGGALVGGVVGAAVGNAIGPDRGYRHGRGYTDTRVYVNSGPSYYQQPAPVYYEPAPVYVRPAPVYVEPAPVYVRERYYAPAPVYYYGPGRGHHHRHGW